MKLIASLAGVLFMFSIPAYGADVSATLWACFDQFDAYTSKEGVPVFGAFHEEMEDSGESVGGVVILDDVQFPATFGFEGLNRVWRLVDSPTHKVIIEPSGRGDYVEEWHGHDMNGVCMLCDCHSMTIEEFFAHGS